MERRQQEGQDGDKQWNDKSWQDGGKKYKKNSWEDGGQKWNDDSWKAGGNKWKDTAFKGGDKTWNDYSGKADYNKWNDNSWKGCLFNTTDAADDLRCQDPAERRSRNTKKGSARAGTNHTTTNHGRKAQRLMNH